MHKFFCNYNTLTEKYELSLNKNMLFNQKINVLAENTLLPEIKNTLQQLYDNTILLKEKISDENKLKILDESELLISNLYYSLFSSPLNIDSNTDNQVEIKIILVKCVEEAGELEAKVNIPEYNRLCMLLKNNFQNLLNSFS